jgi:hypothetical protein
LGQVTGFDIEIENGECSLLDPAGNLESIIIRKREHYQTDFLDGWAGGATIL